MPLPYIICYPSAVLHRYLEEARVGVVVTVTATVTVTVAVTTAVTVAVTVAVAIAVAICRLLLAVNR